MVNATEIRLSGKNKLFADFYLGEASLNQTRAARMAGYAGDDNALAAAGSRLLRNVKVRAYIDQRLSEIALSKSEVLKILTNHAKAAIGDVLDEEGEFNFRHVKQRGFDGLIKKLKVRKSHNAETDVTETVYEYEMYDAQAAAVQLGKVHGLFSDKVDHTHRGTVNLVTQINVQFTDDVKPPIDEE